MLACVMSGFCLKAQNPSYNQLVSIISAKVPGADVSGKLIAFVSWSASNPHSRETNKEFDRVSTIYQGAKLKNGSRGALLISCNIDDAATATIVANKDGISYAIRVNISEFNFLNTLPGNSNVVYDANGAKIYEGLAKQDVLMSYNQLITR
jgi:hypothetical protein